MSPQEASGSNPLLYTTNQVDFKSLPTFGPNARKGGGMSENRRVVLVDLERLGIPPVTESPHRKEDLEGVLAAIKEGSIPSVSTTKQKQIKVLRGARP